MKVYVTSDVSTRQIIGYSETKPKHDIWQQRLQLFDKQVVKVNICKFNNTRRLDVGYLRRLSLQSIPYFTSELTQFLLKSL
jgi:sulfur relay (sulfurtransferase) complex TusBCD TusD component (DsrE family)